MIPKPKLPLDKLLNGLIKTKDHPSIMITGITSDSRKVKPGFVFFVLRGAKTDGKEFAEAAINAGAIVIICEEDVFLNVPEKIIVIRANNSRLLFAQMAARFYEQQPKHMVAVTGTNGKTSVAFFYAQLCHLLGYKSAAVGTIGIFSGDGKEWPIEHSGLTTPEPEQLHDTLRQLANLGVTYAAMEASSHGLSQYRLHGVKVQAAAFTNLSRDHLDYHKTLEEYFMSKMKLFSQVLPKEGVAVINADSDQAERVIDICQKAGHPIFTFGRKGKEIKILYDNQTICGQEIEIECLGKKYKFDVPVIGSFQISNLMCALGLAIASGLDAVNVIAVLPRITGVPGRMEKLIGSKNKATVVVDYAHTPDGLEKALNELKEITVGKLWVVFGCGGDRDKGKRPLMGEIAARLADHVIVTDDNPRTEDAPMIRSEVTASCPHAQNIGDREEAIEKAIRDAAPEDTVLIAGKGHEKYQIIGSDKIPFDDVAVAEKYLR